MPRALVVSNGNVFVDFDEQYVMRDLTYPHVGLWDHTKGNPQRFGVWVDGQFQWSDGQEGWIHMLDAARVRRYPIPKGGSE